MQGIYGVRLFLNGTWEYVIVDDYVGLLNGQLCYASSQDTNEVWLPVLEKAIAKACCCWENIDGGYTGWAMELLTGGLVDWRDSIQIRQVRQSADELWEQAAALIARGDILAVSTGTDEDIKKGLHELGMLTDIKGVGMAGESVLECGLVAGHAYSLLGVAEYDGTKLYKIRNTWGTGEWTGAW